MLCDDLAHAIHDKKFSDRLKEITRGNVLHYAQAVEHQNTLTRRIGNAQRYVLSPLVIETINQLAEDPEAIERSREHLFWPAELTWVEWHGETSWYPGNARLGMLFGGVRPQNTPDEPEIRFGELIFWLTPSPLLDQRDMVMPRSPLYTHCDLPGAFPESTEYDIEADNIDPKYLTPILELGQERITPGTLMKDDLDLRQMGAWVGAMLALINTPRLSQVVKHEHKAQNKNREKQKKPPLLSWGEVVLTVDRGEIGLGEQIVQTGQRALHHVRAFLRIRFGKVELVKPHWRGNREVGVRKTRHVVTRAEDEGGEWKGGVLPGPRVITDRFDEE